VSTELSSPVPIVPTDIRVAFRSGHFVYLERWTSLDQQNLWNFVRFQSFLEHLFSSRCLTFLYLFRMASPHIAGLAAYMLSTEWAKSAALADAQELLESTPGYKQLFFGARNAPIPKEPVVSPKTLKNAMIKIGTKGILGVSSISFLTSNRALH
jgi:hypothetical protein